MEQIAALLPVLPSFPHENFQEPCRTVFRTTSYKALHCIFSVGEEIVVPPSCLKKPGVGITVSHRTLPYLERK